MDVKMNFDAVMLTLSATLGLSVVVERVLEFLKNILEPRIGSRVSWALPPAHSDTTDNQKRLADTEKTALAIEDAPETLDRELSEIRARLDTERSTGERKKLKDRLVTLETIQEWEERFPPGTVLVEPATDADDGTTLRVFVLHLIGFALGILLARIANVQVFHAFLGNAGEMRPWVDTVFTGLLIGGGSAPVHVLIRFISERKVPATAAALDVQEQRLVPAAVVQPSTPDIDGWVDIAYEGGVDRDKLEQTHHRPGDPDMIVYHHTAMNSRSTFEDVVRVIKTGRIRGGTTGSPATIASFSPTAQSIPSVAGTGTAAMPAAIICVPSASHSTATTKRTRGCPTRTRREHTAPRGRQRHRYGRGPGL